MFFSRSEKPKSLFISHGGGPLPLLGDAGHEEMLGCLQMLAESIPKPDAIVVVSAHWEAEVVTITSAKNPSLIYDYYGFPEQAYAIEYPCAGLPSLAEEIHTLINEADIETSLDDSRGFDHGLFIPLKIMYPHADIPCVQLSLVASLDPLHHIKIGHALKTLSDKNVLVIGSGFSFHNLNAFFNANTEEDESLNIDFENWLRDTCSNEMYAPGEREQKLVNWSKAPGALFCHPREEHLLPLHVCYGVAKTASKKVFQLKIMGKQSSMYLW